MKTDDRIRRAAVTPLLARLVSLIVSSSGSILATRILVEKLGTEGFAVASLVTALMVFHPVFGAGSQAVIVNAIARGGSSHLTEGVLLHAARRQFRIGFGLLIMIGVLAALLENRVLRDGDQQVGLLALTGAALAVAVAASSGQGVLQGRGLQAVLSLLPALGSMITLFILWLVPWPQGSLLAAASPSLSTALMSVSLLVFAIGRWRQPIVGLQSLLHGKTIRPQQAPGTNVFTAATVVTLSMSLYFISDRYLLAPFAGPGDLATYVTLQIPLAALIALNASVADGLWPLVETRRAQGGLTRSMCWRVIGLTFSIGIAIGGLTCLLGPPLVRFMLPSAVNVVPLVILVGVTAALYGLMGGAMTLLRTEEGFRTLAFLWISLLFLKLLLGPLVSNVAGPAGVLSLGIILLAVGGGIASWRVVRQFESSRAVRRPH